MTESTAAEAGKMREVWEERKGVKIWTGEVGSGGDPHLLRCPACDRDPYVDPDDGHNLHVESTASHHGGYTSPTGTRGSWTEVRMWCELHENLPLRLIIANHEGNVFISWIIG